MNVKFTENYMKHFICPKHRHNQVLGYNPLFYKKKFLATLFHSFTFEF